MSSPNPAVPVAAWTNQSADWGATVRYGPHVPDERVLRLLGTLAGKRVLALGTGQGQLPAELSRAGAKVIGVEPSATAIEATRIRCQQAGVVVEVHHRDLAELAFVRADTIDLAVSVLALAGVPDLTRLFRQLHRVLRPDAALVFSLPHPLLAVFESGEAGSYVEPAARHFAHGVDYTHTIGATFTALTRTGFRVDTLLELGAERPVEVDEFWQPVMERVPAVLLIRARKVGAKPTAP